MLLPPHKTVFGTALALAVLSTLFLFLYGRSELVPQLWTSILVGLLSYFACVFTSEKMRLDLLQQRFQIYEKTLEFCSVVFAHGSLEVDEHNRQQIEQAVQAAHESFRGIGWHRAQALFGEDIAALFRKLNESYAHISTYGQARTRKDDFDVQEYWKHVTRIANLAAELPSHFKPYIYFGDYKRLAE